MKAVVYDRCGEPSDVLQVREMPMPSAPSRNQVRVRMIASPVNPSDILRIKGNYGELPSFPASSGFEGVGVIDVAGPGVLRLLRGLRPGRRVAVLNSKGENWQEFVNLPARQVVPVPDDLPDDQVASFFVNPATVLVMVKHVLNVKPGDWLLQTAAGSALGHMVIRLGQHLGFRTINVVRRREQAEELKKLGVETICSSDESIEQRALAITKGVGVPFALDAVGGSTGQGAARSLASDGRLLVYGTLSGEPIAVEPRVLIVGQKQIAGFWLSEWVRQQGVLSMLRLFREIVQHMRLKVLTTSVAASFPLDQVQAAVKQATTPGGGKVLLLCGARS
jgi:NADPH:quinone reductase